MNGRNRSTQKKGVVEVEKKIQGSDFFLEWFLY